VTVEDRAIISGLVAVHQFVRIGTYSFIGGCSRVAKDIPPYLKAVGNPVKLYGLNSVGLQRNNFDPTVLRELKRAYRLFFRSELNVTQALERARQELQMYPEVEHFLSFVDASGRGVVM
jgi:UDP-N-acetylglucosamine acyltransferase